MHVESHRVQDKLKFTWFRLRPSNLSSYACHELINFIHLLTEWIYFCTCMCVYCTYLIKLKQFRLSSFNSSIITSVLYSIIHYANVIFNVISIPWNCSLFSNILVVSYTLLGRIQVRIAYKTYRKGIHACILYFKVYKGKFSYLTTNNCLNINIKPNDLASILGHMFIGWVTKVEAWLRKSNATYMKMVSMFWQQLPQKNNIRK